MKCPRCTYTIVSTSNAPHKDFPERKLHECSACLFQWYTFGEPVEETKMTTTWTDATGTIHQIHAMPTPYIENCLSLIDERILNLIKRVAVLESARTELRIKQEQKAEMMRVLHERRRARPSDSHNTCYNCKHYDVVMNQAICKKHQFFCNAVKFTCGAWEKI